MNARSTGTLLVLLFLLVLPSAALEGGDAGGPIGSPFKIALCEDGTLLAAGYDEKIALYHANGTCIWERPYSNLRDIALSNSGELIAAAGPGIRLFNKTGDSVWEFQNGYFVYAVSLSGNGTLLVAGVDDETLRYFDWSGGDSWSRAFPDDILSIAITADGRYIAAGTEGGEVYLFRADGEELWHYQLPGREVAHIAASGDGSTIAASSAHEVIHVFNRNGKALWSRAYPGISGLSVSMNGSLIAAGGDGLSLFGRDGTPVRSYDLKSPVTFSLSQVLAIHDAHGLVLLALDEGQDTAGETDRNGEEPSQPRTPLPTLAGEETPAVESGTPLTLLLTGMAVPAAGWLLVARRK